MSNIEVEVRITPKDVMDYKESMEGLLPQTTDVVQGFLAGLCLMKVPPSLVPAIGCLMFGRELYVQAVAEGDANFDAKHGQGASMGLRAAAARILAGQEGGEA